MNQIKLNPEWDEPATLLEDAETAFNDMRECQRLNLDTLASVYENWMWLKIFRHYVGKQNLIYSEK